ncbi:putative ran guanine nucleotide release factor [Porphyridium purpureum]|uniref:Putative ran guanine nucleotide release factor n=1 Tax=Porphyridium purpureum TaxID=35688 RepID=A0A5J4Z9N4_PORPP|nr:putative ran guanine nucleotide release factor [Porphyridium purpureum]|eukprot:POR4077..scf295_1
MTVARRELYGGAMLMELPERMLDASAIRQVPDHQMVYVDPQGDASVIVELLELEAQVEQTRDAALFHARVYVRDCGGELVDANNELLSAQIEVSPELHASCWMVEATMNAAKFNEDPSLHAQRVRVMLAVLRITRVDTDLLLIVNDPIGSQSDNLPFLTMRQFQDMVKSITIADWGLFGGDS